jgi:galactokinase
MPAAPAVPADCEDASLGSLARTAAFGFAGRFGRPPRWLAAAPGRVNLIGEHTDYNGGFVLPMAIARHVVIAAAPAAESAPSRVRVHSSTLDQTVDVPLAGPVLPGEPRWANYLRGVIAGFQCAGFAPPSLDLWVASTLPVGAGLSSSAALEVATATLLEAATGAALEARAKAHLCRRAEQDYARVPCGLMDQLASVLGDESGPMLIDCTSEGAVLVPLADAETSVLICNSNVTHTLADGAYAERRAQCAEAARVLGVPLLRGATLPALAAAREAMDPVAYRRARHVIMENARTLAMARALAAGDLATAGRRMYESHRSLRDDFEVSCPELDALVDAAAEIGEAGGVWGARLTGGGFGGCAVALVRRERIPQVKATLAAEYRRRTGLVLTAFVSRPARGTHLVS